MKIKHTIGEQWRAASLAAVLLAATAAAQAAYVESPQLHTNASVALGGLGNYYPSDLVEKQIDGPFSGVVSNNHALMLPEVGGANASAYAGYGVLGVSANVSVRSAPTSKTEPSGSGGVAKVGAEFIDVLLIDSPGLTGQRGTMMVPWLFSGTWGGGLTGPLPRNAEEAHATWRLQISTGGSVNDNFQSFSEIHAFGEFYVDKDVNEISSGSNHRVAPGGTSFVEDSAYDTATLPTIWSELSFIFGAPLTLGADLSIDTGAYVSNEGIDLDDPGYLQLRSADAYGEFGHTLRWGGVEQLLDANGNAVTDWTISAQSGVDYAVANTTAVPEPATWLSMLIGLLVITLQPVRRGLRQCVERSRARHLKALAH